MPTIADTLTLATLLHDGVNDCTGTPYIAHPTWVMNALPFDAIEDDRHLALLHDTLEDCKARLSELLCLEHQRAVAPTDLEGLLEFYVHRGYSSYVIDGMRLLTRDFWHGMTYLHYVRQIAGSGHRGAMWVKYRDNCHNSDQERIDRVLPEFRQRVMSIQSRYERSKRILRRALGTEIDDPLV